MPIELKERFHSPVINDNADDPTVERLYILRGESNAEIARQAVWQMAPLMYENLVLNDVSLNRQGDDWWHVSCTYGAVKPLSTGGVEYTFDTMGATTKITNSLQTLNVYVKEGDEATVSTNDYIGAIGYDGKTVNGCDIPIPTFQWTEKYRVPATYVTPAYRRILAELTGTMCNGNFREFGPAEVLFMGARGRFKGNHGWDMEYHFTASPSMSNLTVGEITSIIKRGYDYLWIRYGEKHINGDIFSVPKKVYIEKVFNETNFALLGLGTAALQTAALLSGQGSGLYPVS